MRSALMFAVCVWMLATLSGCPSVRLAQPVSFAHPLSVTQDTFSIQPTYWDKSVVYVEFMTKDRNAGGADIVALIGPCKGTMTAEMEDSKPFTSVWAIRAIHPVSAKDVQIVPGVVPPSFEQVFPRSSRQFKPSLGQEYYVVVCLEPVEESFYSVGVKWTPSVGSGGKE